MTAYVIGLEAIDRTQVASAGGKGAHLGELSRLGVRVPPGFCVTTDAFERALRSASIEERVERLAQLSPDDRDAIGALSAELRQRIEAVEMGDEAAEEIRRQLALLGERAAYAVRSSATAEDLPTASFAGQQDTYLNVVGLVAILEHVRRCWASLFSERAVTYRLRNGFDERALRMAVVVQRMVFPRASGVLFTADPVSGHRKVASIDAVFGLGEALVSGRVNADVYKVRDGAILERTVAEKWLALVASAAGGTEERSLEPAQRRQPVLTDAQALRLAQLGLQIQAHFGGPQDIEWCLAGEDFHIVQSRPITTLFPVVAAGDGENHVYVSVGHQQMMTEAMKPLGISLWQLTAGRPMFEAGGRLFVDVTGILASPASRAGFLALAKSDPLIGDALETLLERRDFIPELANAPAAAPPMAPPPAIETDPAIVSELFARSQTSIAACRREIRGKSGAALLEFIRADLQELKRHLFDPRGHAVVMAGVEATWWLNDQLYAWLGEKGAADVLTQSVPNNVTSEMGLALLDVADAIRPHHEVVSFLEGVKDDGFLDELPHVAGGRQARDAILAWLDKYGMRCPGEIDITRPRWSEDPSMLVPLLLGNVENFEPGAGQQRFEQGRQQAAEKERQVLERLRALPGGEEKALETKRKIDRVRTFIGYREYPKYAMISRYFVYKQALMEEAERLVQAGVLRDREDIFHFSFEELEQVLTARRADERLLHERKQAFRWHQTLTPPRVVTSDGEIIRGAYRREDVPPGALVGVAVSAGTVEGRARVISNLAEADLEPNDILVTAYTDPSWTPLFVTIKGLVTEVGGLMTHGAVIAREYGVPAVVGVEQATRLIRDGQQIRVHGAEGYVELLSQ